MCRSTAAAFAGSPRLSPVIAPLEANRRTDGGVIRWAAFAQLGGGPGKICAKAARFNDSDFDAERSDLFEQRFRETLNPELRGGNKVTATGVN